MDKRFLVGIAYNLLIEPGAHQGEVQLKEVKAAKEGSGADARHRLYHDPLVRLPRDEMMRDGGDYYWRNKPILVNHVGESVGRINSARIVDGRVEISAEVTDAKAIARIDKGELGSFSVGYDVRASADGSGQRRFDVKEVSLCHEPFFEGCTISVVASKDAPHSASKPEEKEEEEENARTLVHNIMRRQYEEQQQQQQQQLAREDATPALSTTQKQSINVHAHKDGQPAMDSSSSNNNKSNTPTTTTAGSDGSPASGQQQQQQNEHGSAAPSFDMSKFNAEREQWQSAFKQQQEQFKEMQKQLKSLEQEKARLSAARVKEQTPKIERVAKFWQAMSGQKEISEPIENLVVGAFTDMDPDNAVATTLLKSAESWEKQQQELETLQKSMTEKDKQIEALQKKDQQWREQFKQAQEQLSQRSAFGAPSVADIFKSSIVDPSSGNDEGDGEKDGGNGQEQQQGAGKGKKRKRDPEMSYRDELVNMLNMRPWDQKPVSVTCSRDTPDDQKWKMEVFNSIDEPEDRRNFAYDSATDDVKAILHNLTAGVGSNKRARADPNKRIQRLNPEHIAKIRASGKGTIDGEDLQTLPGQH